MLCPNKLLLLSLFCLLPTALASAVYYVGHSLVNHNMPRVVQQIADDLNQSSSYREAIINGSPLRYHWNNPGNAEGNADVRVDLPGGNYDTLVLTESVPLHATFQWNSPVYYAQQFIGLAQTARSDLRVILFETWPHLNNISPRPWHASSWDEEIDQDLILLEGAADELDVNLSQPVTIIPAALALRQLRDEIDAGNIPGIHQLSDLFADDIHLTEEGNYFMGLVFFAGIYGRSPEGATGRIINQYGGTYVDVPSSRRTHYQQIAWQVVSQYSRGGGSNPNPDSDGDGVPDSDDLCPNSQRGPLVFGDCDSGLPNPVSAQGCTLLDQITACQPELATRQELVDCVTAAAGNFRAIGALNAAQEESLITCAQSYGLPLAVDDNFFMTEQTTLHVPAPGLLLNDVDSQGDPLEVFLYEAPIEGQLNLASDGSFSYIPASNQLGPITFVYGCDDGTGYRTATVTINVMPSGGDSDGDGISDNQDNCPNSQATATLVINGCDSGAPNLHLGDGCFLSDEVQTIAASRPPRWRFVSMLRTRINHYRGQGLLTQAEVDAIVQCAWSYDLPTAVPDNFIMPVNGVLEIPAPGLLLNDFDLEGDPMETHLDLAPSVGNLTLFRDGSFRFVPPSGHQGTVLFRYRNYDGKGYRTARVTIELQ